MVGGRKMLYIAKVKNLEEAKNYEKYGNIFWARNRKEAIEKYGEGAKLLDLCDRWIQFESYDLYEMWVEKFL